ncbi:glucosaminidase domain-containing protein [Paenibacillus sp. NPDC058071]|uniref:glucosaminidase domain-containing protein n=1 Tax=Paenibacillus sp. NPDC058071 TaxID=3346326 RepID=UPI0036D77B10
MRNHWSRKAFVFILCAALLITLGMKFDNRNDRTNTSALAAPATLVEQQEELLPADDSEALLTGLIERQSEATLKELNERSVHIAGFSGSESASDEGSYTEPTGTDEGLESDSGLEESSPAPELKPEVIAYRVTAHYLNVRSEPNADSGILEVAEQNDVLQVAEALANGWLKLKDKGFVHGKYAVPTVPPGPSSDAAQPTQNAAAASVNSGDQQNPPAERADIPDALTLQDFIDRMPDQPPASEEPVKPTGDISSDSGLTREHVAAILKNTALAGHGLEEAILDVEEEYGINAYFTIAVMKLESGNGKSKLARNKNNLFGLNATGSNAHARAFSFETKGDSVRKFGQLLEKNYVKKGYTTVPKVAKKYCPANPDWAGLVLKIMKSDYKKL